MTIERDSDHDNTVEEIHCAMCDLDLSNVTGYTPGDYVYTDERTGAHIRIGDRRFQVVLREII